jgi:hypothetical protein
LEETAMKNLAYPGEEVLQLALRPCLVVTEAGPVCEKCGAEIQSRDSLICQRCGWYASIHSYIEIDHAWEGIEYADSTEKGKEASHERFALPAWAWVLVACVLGVVAESFVARLVTPAESTMRTVWSVSQLIVGAIVFAVGHFIAHILLSRDDSEVGLVDLLLKPFRPWIALYSRLPDHLLVCHFGAVGLAAILGATLVIGGIPYERLLDWGFKKPVKESLIGAIAAQAREQEGGSDTLEESVQDFAGQQDLTEGGAGSEKKEKTESPAAQPLTPLERRQEDCLIVGYRANAEGLAYLVYLAGESGGQLHYVGQTTPRLPLDELRQFSRQLADIQTVSPFVTIATDEKAVWVEPKLTCRVSYSKRGKKGGLHDIHMESLLGAVSLPSLPGLGASQKLMRGD